MSYNGSGVFNINSTGQPVVTGTSISSTAFNALTADLATGLSTAICKDGQTTVTANIPMANYKITGLGTGTATTDAAAVQNVNLRSMCEGRLTLTSGTPVTTASVSGAETLYFTPYKGNCIALFDGTNWVRRTFSELSIDVPDATNMYDVFVYDNSGTAALELAAWASLTTRATDLTTQDGVLVKTGALTRRYVGSFYCTTAGNGQINDLPVMRGLWNYYNRVAKDLAPNPLSGTSWNYTTATIRQANADTGNQLNFCIGVVEDLIEAVGSVNVYNSNQGVEVRSGLGMNTTSSFTSYAIVGVHSTSGAGSSYKTQVTSSLRDYPAIGLNYIALLEYSAATGTTTWDVAPAGQISSVQGWVLC